jgi:uncharacterized protein (DUF433 family)
MATERIEIDSAVLGGKPVVRGTRIPVEDILRKLSEGATEAELLEAYPRITREDIHAALRYAADAVAHEVIVLTPATQRPRAIPGGRKPRLRGRPQPTRGRPRRPAARPRTDHAWPAPNWPRMNRPLMSERAVVTRSRGRTFRTGQRRAAPPPAHWGLHGTGGFVSTRAASEFAGNR